MQVVDECNHRLIRLAGRLSAEQVHELLEASRGGQPVLRLDLSELISVDLTGLEVLLDLQQSGAELFDVPPYIQLKLDSLSAKRRKHWR